MIFLVSYLIVISLIDIRVRKVHNASILVLLCYAVYVQLTGQDLHIESAFFMLFLLIATNVIMLRLFKKDESLGYGDVKLIAALSLFLSISQSLYCLLISTVLSIPFMCFIRNRSIPFAPFISIGFLSALLFF